MPEGIWTNQSHLYGFQALSSQWYDLKKERVLQIDATCNDVGCGAVLLQEYEDDICQ